MNSSGLIQKRILHGSVIFLVLSSLLYVAQNCGKNPSSRLKSLDNFAAGRRVKTNVCSGDPALANEDGLNVALSALTGRIDYETKGDKKQLEVAVKTAFSAVPADIQNLFLTLNGRVLVTDNANGVCTNMDRQMASGLGKAFKAEELKALEEDMNSVTSCYLFGVPSITKQITGQDGQMLTLVLPGSVTEIKHSLVRSIGYLVSNVFSHLVYSMSDNVITWVSLENPSFTAKKDEVAAGFLQDVAKSGFAGRFTKYQNGGSATPAEKKSFTTFVYAEAFDSFYCNTHAKNSDNTLQTMIKNFPNSYAAFLGQKTNSSGSVTLPVAYVGEVTRQVSINTTSTIPNLPFQETLFVVDWLKQAAANRSVSAKPEASSETENEFALTNSNSRQSWASRAWNNFTSPITETVTGAGVLWGEYKQRSQAATERSLAQYSGGGRVPTISQQALAAVEGTATGFGYNKYYNNTMNAIQRRQSQGQSTFQSSFGGVSDSTGYTNKYNQVYERTNKIANQVMSDPTYNNNSAAWKTVMGASIVANGVVDDVSRLPKIGDYAAAAKNYVTYSAGGNFDSSGNYKDATAWEQYGALGSTLYTTGKISGANKAIGAYMTDKAATGISYFEGSRNPFISQTASKVGDVFAVSEAVYNPYRQAIKDSEFLKEAKDIKDVIKPIHIITSTE